MKREALPRLPKSNPCVQKLDRLPWCAGFSFVAHGRCFGVRSNDPSLLAQIRRRLPPGAKRCQRRVVDRLYSVIGGDGASPAGGRGVRRFHLLYVNALRLARTMDVEEILDAFDWMIELDVATGASHHVFVHAG